MKSLTFSPEFRCSFSIYNVVVSLIFENIKRIPVIWSMQKYSLSDIVTFLDSSRYDDASSFGMKHNQSTIEVDFYYSAKFAQHILFVKG